jgi:hypothetical protein
MLASAGCSPSARAQGQQPLFATADNCMACHNSLKTATGEDMSIGTAWRASMMANSARDPYWQASVRRETIDHPKAADEIEDECAVCHMPMARTTAAARKQRGQVFAHLPVGEAGSHEGMLAADGVSCTACHQITPKLLGTRESFSGGYSIDLAARPEERPLYGPFPVESGRVRIMHSATGFRPEQSDHVRQSELCATCHTLYTKARDESGAVVGEFPEQVPYLEWRHSSFASQRSCIACHMPVVEGTARMSSVLGEPREGVARHDFRGGNAFMLKMLNRYRDELAVQAQPAELDAAVQLAAAHLRTSATLALDVERDGADTLRVVVNVANLAGHKLPTAYPSRRAWIHVTVRDTSGRTIFESGALQATGAITGNDNDENGSRFEPHHTAITSPDQVQIYESILGDTAGGVTTGLLKAVRYLKDNRLLPQGFDKRTAHADIAVRGSAADDADFAGGGDRVLYVVSTAGVRGNVTIEASLMYQPIGFRWADNLRQYQGIEPKRFVQYYDAMSAGSAEVLARGGTTYSR